MANKCFKSIHRFIIFVIIGVATSCGDVFAAQDSDLELNKAVKIAVDENPNLSQMLERYRAFLEIPSQVGSLPDPTINLNAMNLPTSSFSTTKTQ